MQYFLERENERILLFFKVLNISNHNSKINLLKPFVFVIMIFLIIINKIFY